MAIHYRVWALALAVCLFASTALADDQEGLYVTLNAGPSFASQACKSSTVTAIQSIGGSGSCSEKSIGYRAGIGYQYTPMWAVEVSYGTFGYAETSGSASFPPPVGPGTYNWSLKALGLAVQAVATVHMGDVLSVFGKFGLARVEFDEYLGVMSPTLGPGYSTWYYGYVIHENRNALALGGGVQFSLTPHADLRLMLETFGSHDIYTMYGQSDKVKLVMSSLGFVYRY